jgi:hypothetical protein
MPFLFVFRPSGKGPRRKELSKERAVYPVDSDRRDKRRGRNTDDEFFGVAKLEKNYGKECKKPALAYKLREQPEARRVFMRIKVTVQGGVVQDIETAAPALVQIVDLDTNEVSTFETVAQDVAFDADPEEPQLTDLSTPAP